MYKVNKSIVINAKKDYKTFFLLDLYVSKNLENISFLFALASTIILITIRNFRKPVSYYVFFIFLNVFFN